MNQSGLTFDSLQRSPLVKLMAIGFLLLALQIPIALVRDLLGERETTRAQAVEEISRSWGGAQEIAGPFLVVPYRFIRAEIGPDGKPRTITHETHATFLPRSLDAVAALRTQTLYRGIFEAPVYRAGLTMSGTFDRPDFSTWNINKQDVLWERAEMAFEIVDVRAIENEAALEWNGRSIPFEPGLGLRGSGRSGVRVPLGSLEGDSFEFRTELTLNGSRSLKLAPLGRRTTVQASADWPDPSFQGAWLPVSRTVEAGAFEASWDVPYLGRNFPHSWRGGESHAKEIQGALFGFDLLTPTDGYRRTERSLKYQALFLGLTFLTIWLFEALSGARVHIIQYGLIGAALCLFYLLELSLSEHLGFGPAYLLAAAAVVALVSLYGSGALPTAAQARTVTATIAGLYGYLYVLIQLQDYALLAGSLGLLAILAVVMFATRRVNWYAPRPV